jgi:hypothetical protein
MLLVTSLSSFRFFLTYKTYRFERMHNDSHILLIFDLRSKHAWCAKSVSTMECTGSQEKDSFASEWLRFSAIIRGDVLFAAQSNCSERAADGRGRTPQRILKTRPSANHPDCDMLVEC